MYMYDCYIARLSLNKMSTVSGWFLVTCPWSNSNKLVSFAFPRVLMFPETKSRETSGLSGKQTNCFPRDHTLRWLKTVSSTVLFKTWILRGHYNHSILADANIMVSPNCPIIGEQVAGNKLYICVRYSNVNVVYIWSNIRITCSMVVWNYTLYY